MRTWKDSHLPALDETPLYDVAICGGGPAGMVAAEYAALRGASTILIERNAYLGGVLPQCVHDGFGLHTVGENLTGPGYIQMLVDRLERSEVDVLLDTCVTSIHAIKVGQEESRGLSLTAVGPCLGGEGTIRARQVILATGCQERTRGMLRIPGFRPAGVMTAGAAQHLVNVMGYLPGHRVVILGSGDVGLIMARRLKLEGADIRMVLGQASTGLYRNHVQCIQEMGIELREGWTVTEIHGRNRVESVSIAQLDDMGTLVPESTEEIDCDTLLIAAGLIPDHGLITEGLADCPNIHLAGNASRIHDLVDGAAVEAARIGSSAAEQALLSRSAPVRELQSGNLTTAVIPASQVGSSATETLRTGCYKTLCTACPSGCLLEVDLTEETMTVRGNECPRGEEQLLDSLNRPERIFTGTVMLEGRIDPALLPVHTSEAVPIEQLFAMARETRHIQAPMDIRRGDTVVADILGSGCDLVASCDARLVVPDATEDPRL